MTSFRGACSLLVLVSAMSSRASTLPADGLGDAAWAWLEEQRMSFHPRAAGNGYWAANIHTELGTHVHAHGFRVSGPLPSPAWEMEILVTGLQRTDGPLLPWEPLEPCANSTELIWTGTAMDLQYLHSEEGMRQNFLVSRKPAGDAPLQILLRYEGDLIASELDGHGLRFVDPFGHQRATYEGLRVWDACGEVLPAKLAITDPCTGAFSITVDDRGATYPLTVDPIATSPSRSITGTQGGAQFGFAVNSAGDLNGDGYGDIAVGAPTMSMGEYQEGVVFVYYGSANGIGAVADVVLQADLANANFGNAVAHAGDVNGDGFSDLIVGAPNWNNSASELNEGAMFIYHGSATGITNVPAIILQPNSPNKFMGFDVAGLGDINGDGYSDIIGGGWLAAYGQSNEGAAWVYLGGPTGFTNDPAHRLERNQGGAQFGYSVAGPGDINGDGYDDVVVGAYRFNLVQANDGALFVYFGGPGSSPLGPGTTAQPLNPAPAQTFNSAGISRHFAWSVAGAGDVNGDGFADVITGDWRDDISGTSQVGTAFVFHGSPAGLITTPATVVEGSQASGWLGRSVSSAGDVNGDGYADVLIGEMNHTDVFSNQGAAYLHLGSPSGISPTPFHKYIGPGSGAAMGTAVGNAGDVNGDGFSDIILGSRNHISRGTIGIYHGGAYAINTPASMAAPPPQLSIPGFDQAHAGWSVAHAGDVNGDGYSDVIVGAPGASNGQAGEGLAFVHYGKPGGIDAIPDLVLEVNVAGAAFGTSVRTAGDVNGDGYSDVIVGAPNAGSGGRAYLFMGGPAGLASTPALVLNGPSGSLFGTSVGTAGDVNTDGFSDVIVGAPGNATARVFLGAPGGLDPVPHVVISSPQSGSEFGHSVATAGDVNGDGFSDVIIGAPSHANGAAAGAAFIYHGSSAGISNTPATSLFGDQAGCRFGISVSSAGDFNGSGVSDVVIGADQWASGQALEGGAFIHFGGPSGIAAGGAITLQSNVVGARFGHSVCEAGDVNGDGYADIVIGAPFFSGSLSEQGRVYVYHGKALPPITGEHQNGGLAGARMGWAVAGVGDTDGDGFSDILVGGPTLASPLAGEGGYLCFRGNRLPGINRLTRQYQADLASPLSVNSMDFADPAHFGIGHVARNHMSRRPGRLHWEVVHEGEPFSGSPITNSVASNGVQGTWTDLGLNGVELKQLVYKQEGRLRYKWRCRVEYPIHRSPDGQRFSRWFYGFASSHGDIGVLPIELVSMAGQALQEGNLITWSTASEKGTARFVVQRGQDMDHFVDLGTVSAAGNSQELRSYSFLDQYAPSGVAYYRLRIEDEDGGVELSPLVAVERKANSTTFHPNPVVDQLHWNIQNGQEAQRALVFDAAGRLVVDATGKPGSLGPRHLRDLGDGIYTLLLLDASGGVIARTRFVLAQAPMVR